MLPMKLESRIVTWPPGRYIAPPLPARLFVKVLFVPVFLSTLVVVAWFTVALGIYLAYSLFFIIKTPCPLCLASHAINLALALLLMRA